MREIRTGEIYRHFKGNLYQIVAVARHSETNEEYVVYQALYGEMQVWVRPYELFVSEVDHEKYPQVQQKYRFELLNTLAQGMPGRTQKDMAAEERKVLGAEERQTSGTEERPEHCQVPEKKEMGEPKREEETEPRADERLLNFLDAKTCQDKINYLTLIRNNIDDRLISDIAAAMDITVDEGPLDARYFSLKNCLMTKAKYECGRR